MGEVFNLRRARKAKTRAAAVATADVNRAVFGRGRAERDATAAEIDRTVRTLDGAKRDA